MTKAEVRQRIQEIGIIPAVRMHSAEDAMFAAEAVCAGGIPIVEIPVTVPKVATVIRELVRRNPAMVVGAETLFDLALARQCLEAGAAFLTGIGFEAEVLSVASAAGVVTLPGAMTPTEVMTAFRAGADFVKVFPCSQLGGPEYIRAIKGALAQVPLIAAGGVSSKNTADYVQAGAAAVGIGRNLISMEAVDRREPSWIAKLAAQYLQLMKKARERHAR